MNHKEAFIGVSTMTALPLFSLITKRGDLSTRTLSRLFDSYGSAIESEYKLPIYKLWQYATKNNPSIYNGKGICFSQKKYSHVRLNSVSYLSSSKRVKQIENDTILSSSVNSKGWSSFVSIPFFYKRNHYNMNWCNMFGFIPHIRTVSRALMHIPNIFKKYRICNPEGGIFKCGRLTSSNDESAMCQSLQKTHKFDVCISRISYHEVCFS